MIVQETYAIVENHLSYQVCQDIVRRGMEQKEQEGTVSEGLNKQIRNSRVTWLKDPWIYDWITPLVRDINFSLNWKFDISSPEDIQFTKYKEKQFYGWHQDCAHEKKETTRKISVVIPLCDSSDYEGGDLQFYDPILKPTSKMEEGVLVDQRTRGIGNVVIFPSYVYHQVTPILKGERLSIVIWYNGKAWS